MDIAIEQLFKELLADTHRKNAEIANAAHACISAMLDWKGRRLLEEEYRQAEIDRQRYRI